MAMAFLGLTLDNYAKATPRLLLEMIDAYRKIEWYRDKQRAMMNGYAFAGQEIPDYPEADESPGQASSFFL